MRTSPRVDVPVTLGTTLRPVDTLPLPVERPDDLSVRLQGALGTTHHIACPGSVEGAPARWASGPVELGHDAPVWAAEGEVRAPAH
jgi:hypothetical protein